MLLKGVYSEANHERFPSNRSFLAEEWEGQVPAGDGKSQLKQLKQSSAAGSCKSWSLKIKEDKHKVFSLE